MGGEAGNAGRTGAAGGRIPVMRPSWASSIPHETGRERAHGQRNMPVHLDGALLDLVDGIERSGNGWESMECPIQPAIITAWLFAETMMGRPRLARSPG